MPTEEDDKRISEWGHPLEKFHSGYGFITYQEWCELECKRMNKRGDSVHILKSGNVIAISR